MERRLSSSLTFFHKAIFPLLWTALFGLVAIRGLVNPEGIDFSRMPGGASLGNRIFLLIVFLAGAVFLYWHGRRLKSVRLVDNHLIVSDYFKEHKISIALIDDVMQNTLLHSRPITIHFKQETPFGRKIVFIPAGVGRIFSFKPDKMVHEIRALAHPHPPPSKAHGGRRRR